MNQLYPTFIDGTSGRLFVLLQWSRANSRTVLLVPSFAEEMNKTRKQYRSLTDALVTAGFNVVTLDLHGTGDSDGEFRDATWRTWKSDLHVAVNWSESRDLPIVVAVATRLGCILLADYCSEYRKSLAATFFWQPVIDGRKYTTNFLRLRTAAKLMAFGSNESPKAIREIIQTEKNAEIAGYELSSSLLRSLDEMTLPNSITPYLGSIECIQITRNSQNANTATSLNALKETAIQKGCDFNLTTTVGEQFWASTEVTYSRGLSELTAKLISSKGL